MLATCQVPVQGYPSRRERSTRGAPSLLAHDEQYAYSGRPVLVAQNTIYGVARLPVWIMQCFVAIAACVNDGEEKCWHNTPIAAGFTRVVKSAFLSSSLTENK